MQIRGENLTMTPKKNIAGNVTVRVQFQLAVQFRIWHVEPSQKYCQNFTTRSIRSKTVQ